MPSLMNQWDATLGFGDGVAAPLEAKQTTNGGCRQKAILIRQSWEAPAWVLLDGAIT